MLFAFTPGEILNGGHESPSVGRAAEQVGCLLKLFVLFE